MPHHRTHGVAGHGIGRRQASAGLIGMASSSVMLDTGGTDEFTFSRAAGFARFREPCPRKQGKGAVAS